MKIIKKGKNIDNAKNVKNIKKKLQKYTKIKGPKEFSYCTHIFCWFDLVFFFSPTFARLVFDARKILALENVKNAKKFKNVKKTSKRHKN